MKIWFCIDIDGGVMLSPRKPQEIAPGYWYSEDRIEVNLDATGCYELNLDEEISGWMEIPSDKSGGSCD